ncbi:MAG: endo alpha-1,4 polygalactosaminidase [Deltaproteobacteria bacterium]|nr:endo alpha-1,4 polygalactosaminidase [Deltaproteobacteria bacterium]
MRAAAIALLAACGGSSSVGTDTGRPGAPPPRAAHFDYQLGGAYPPPAGTTVVARDREAPPLRGFYNICYVNGFQTQPGEAAWWLAEHPDLILRDAGGAPVVDAAWDEMLLDIRTPARRAELAGIMGRWIAGCADAGYDAVELDNLDSYTRSRGLLAADEAVAAMRAFATSAHARALAVAQKNAPDLVARRDELATDFAIVEECEDTHECDGYIAGYGGYVLDVEYARPPFEAGCASSRQMSIVLRDRDLVTPDEAGYLYAGC